MRNCYGLNREWFVGSDHGTDEEPDYQYNLDGWPFFIGINNTATGKNDYHIATGIQDRLLAMHIVRAHNDKLA